MEIDNQKWIEIDSEAMASDLATDKYMEAIAGIDVVEGDVYLERIYEKLKQQYREYIMKYQKM